MKIDIKKIMGETSVDVFDAVDKMAKAQREVLEALHIMQSAIEFPEMVEQNQKRMKAYLTKFCEDELDFDKITDIKIEDIDHSDSPDYCDAFISEAKYNGVDLTEDELITVNENKEFFYEKLMEYLY